jgi:AbrB family looped-hinge helix DNA binding protein
MKRGIAQLSGRGTLTLPAEIRRRLGLEEGDVLMVEVRDGSVVLTPTVLTPVELYTDERVAEFDGASRMTEADLRSARSAWGLPVEPDPA